jgi:uncharacterized repeat protein (TIGR01451 family)
VVTVNGDQPEPAPDPHPNRDSTLTSVVSEPPQPEPPEPPQPPIPEPDGPAVPPVAPPSGAVLGEQVASTRLSLHKRASTDTPVAGGTLSYRLRVANVGDAGALDVRVCDRLPRGLTLVRAPGFRSRGGRLCRSVGKLGIGRARVLHITARVARRPPEVISNVAVARADNARRVRSRSTIGGPCVAAASEPRARIAC